MQESDVCAVGLLEINRMEQPHRLNEPFSYRTNALQCFVGYAHDI